MPLPKTLILPAMPPSAFVKLWKSPSPQSISTNTSKGPDSAEDSDFDSESHIYSNTIIHNPLLCSKTALSLQPTSLNKCNNAK